MEEKEVCPYCGAEKKEVATHSLTTGLVRDLIIFAKRAKEKGENKVHITKELDFSINQWCNFQKLRYFGLVAKWEAEDGNKKTGFWVLTRNGLEFLQGKLSVHKKVSATKKGITERSEEMVCIDDFPQSDENYWQKDFNIEINNGKITNMEEEKKEEKPAEKQPNVLGNCPACKGGLYKQRQFDNSTMKTKDTISCLKCGKVL
jgi:hypothetical protein